MTFKLQVVSFQIQEAVLLPYTPVDIEGKGKKFEELNSNEFVYKSVTGN